MKKKATLIWVILLAIVCSFSCIMIYKVEYPIRTLRQIAQNRLLSQSEENSLLAHFTYRYPDKAGLSKEIRLPVYDKAQTALCVEKDKEDFDTLYHLHCHFLV